MENVTYLISLENATDSVYTSYYKNYTRSDEQTAILIQGICFAVICSVFCLLAIIGNGLVIWFGFFRMKKTVNVVWFLSLAIADFFFALMVPVYVAQTLLAHWTKLFCKLMPLLFYLNTSVSVLQLTVISVDRCICVKFPVWCHNHRRPTLAFIIALIIWIFSLALATPFITYQDTLNNYSGTLCISDINNYISINKTVFGFVFYFLLPFIIIVSCYTIIVLHMRRKCIFTSSKPLKTIAAIIIAFFICWFPSYLLSLYITFGSIWNNFYVIYYGGFVAVLLIIMNSCINPILYVFIGRDFKEKCCGSFQITLEKAFIEDEGKADCENQEGNIALTRAHTEDK
ncbi:chemerin-like receptor 1 isoform X2 [Phyllobates terribilis]|uniref:chemerin-like receptor 1 isoform X2 n=1 Tax=Phyllobates terribilis TaxID=111132 RepID=UPI003CCB47F9